MHIYNGAFTYGSCLSRKRSRTGLIIAHRCTLCFSFVFVTALTAVLMLYSVASVCLSVVCNACIVAKGASKLSEEANGLGHVTDDVT